jgi:hypothetical protein
LRLRDGGGWNAGLRIRLTLSDEQPHVETVTCRKATATLAEERGMIYAKRWVDKQAGRQSP